ncbi:hypothetical protein WG906_07280 [Pedobacter sp. P351]|uniref:hypothetical protein n=1 Tax=Pedobacter superstes TaxID=3133441 RepID=UPI0030B10A6A
MKIIKDYGLKIIHQHFENSCQIELEIPKAQINPIVSKFEAIKLVTLTYLRTL